MGIYNANKPLIFIHVPKCGGISVKEQFKIWFGRKLKYNYINERKGKLPKKHNLKGILKEYKPNLCVYGHFNSNRGFGIKQMYPNVNQFVTILRDPFEVAVSNFFYLNKQKIKNWKDQSKIPNSTLEEYFENCEMNYLNHFPSVVTNENYHDIIDSFIYCGITEDLNESLNILSELISKPSPKKINYLNKSERNVSYDVERLRSKIKTRFPLEFSVYEYVKKNYRNIDKWKKK